MDGQRNYNIWTGISTLAGNNGFLVNETDEREKTAEAGLRDEESAPTPCAQSPQPFCKHAFLPISAQNTCMASKVRK